MTPERLHELATEIRAGGTPTERELYDEVRQLRGQLALNVGAPGMADAARTLAHRLHEHADHLERWADRLDRADDHPTLFEETT